MKSVEIIPVFNKISLEKAIEKLNKKARKLGCPPLFLSFAPAPAYKSDVHPRSGHKLLNPLVIERLEATLEYEEIVLEGWELIARLDVEGQMVFVSAVPEKHVPAEYQHKDSIKCDHCGHNRYRTHSILIRHTETGEYKEVGSTCVKDFFGHNVDGFMFQASILFSDVVGRLDDETGFANYGAHSCGTGIFSVLALTSASIRKWGWRSKGKAYQEGGQATADHVFENLYPNFPSTKDDDLVTVEEIDKKKAEAALEWWTNVEDKGNDYLINCKKLVELGYVPDKFMGFACSMIPTYDREMDKEAERKRKEESGKVSNWVGELKERLNDLLVECVGVKYIDSDWGESTLYTFVDPTGNIFKTFYSGSKFDAISGEKFVLSGTVKKHDEFRGIKSTMLSRIAAKDLPQEAFNADEFAVA